MSGNGGNGGDGKNATMGNIAGGGGAGGNSDDFGKDLSDDAEKTNRSFTGLPGSGGSGGLGMYYNGVNNYKSEYYYKYRYTGKIVGTGITGGGYNDDGYENPPKGESNNPYSGTWIKTAGGSGAAGGVVGENVDPNGSKGITINANNKVLRRGYNRYRNNTSATSGYYWNYNYGHNGGERLFGNLQMTSTFSYYGTKASDTGPRDGNRYISEDDLVNYYDKESFAYGLISDGLVSAAGAIRLAIAGGPWGWIGAAIAGGIAAGLIGWGQDEFKKHNSAMIWGEVDNSINRFSFKQIPVISDIVSEILSWITSMRYDDTVYESGDIYYSDGGYWDYWWLYDERNSGYATNIATNFEKQFNNYLDGISGEGSAINNSNKVWEENFYGGAGAGDGTGNSGNGGTSYTKEIYGYARQDKSKLTKSLEMIYDYGYKCFFTRNDFVTSAGSYGEVADLSKLTVF